MGLIRKRLETWQASDDAVGEIMHTGRNDYVYPLVGMMGKKKVFILTNVTTLTFLN